MIHTEIISDNSYLLRYNYYQQLPQSFLEDLRIDHRVSVDIIEDDECGRLFQYTISHKMKIHIHKACQMQNCSYDAFYKKYGSLIDKNKFIDIEHLKTIKR